MSRIAVGARVLVADNASPAQHCGRAGVVLRDDGADDIDFPYKVELHTTYYADYPDEEWFGGHELIVLDDQTPATPPNATAFEVAVRDAFADAKALLLERHAKYGPKNISASPYGWKAGLITRIWDKLARLKNMEGDTTDESRTDAWLDACNYAIIGLLNERGEWPNA